MLAKRIKSLKKFLAKKEIVKSLPRVIFAAAIIVFLYFNKHLLLSASVNGQMISRINVLSELEKQGSREALESLITKTLILQEAKKQKITVSSAELEAETKKIEEQLSTQGQSLDSILALQGWTKKDFEEQIRIQKLIEKMLDKDLQVTDEEVATYIKENESTQFPEEVKQLLKQQKLSEKFQGWITALRESAKISYFAKL